MSELAALAERALGCAHGDTLVTVRRAHRTGAGETTRTWVEFLTVRDGHWAGAQARALDQETLAAAARSAADTAADQARKGGPGPHPGLPDPAPARPHEGWDPATARLEPPLDLAGATWGACAFEVALASSKGLNAEERVTAAWCEARAGRGFARAASTAVGDLSGAALAQRAATLGHPLSEPVSLGAGEVPAVLRPEAMASLLEFLTEAAFNGRARAESQGAELKLGTRIAAPSLNLSDSPRYSSTVPRSYDAEGVPKAPMPLIQDGVAHRILHDLTSAALTGDAAVSTGHAVASEERVFGAGAGNLVLVGGGAADEEELAAPIRRGVVIGRLEPVYGTDPKTAGFRARVGNGSFVVENGRIGAPLHATTICGSMLSLLAAVEALSTTPRLVLRPGLWSYPSGTVTPAVRVSGLQLL